MLRSLFVWAVVPGLLGLASVGCKREQEEPAAAAAIEAAEVAEVAEVAEANAPGAAAERARSATAATEDLGVPECDAYVREFRRCVETSIPEGQRDMWRKSLQDVTQAWRQALAGPGGASGQDNLARACKVATETAKQSFSEFNCEWK